MKKQPECPECERLVQVSDDSQKIGAFIEWLEERYVIAQWNKYDKSDERLFPARISINHLLAEYYGIDLSKVDREREQLLNWIREQSND